MVANDYKAGVEAGELIVDAVENGTTVPRHIVLPVEMIVRGSTRSLLRAEGHTNFRQFANAREEEELS
jgi:hypothetical protein